MAEKNWRNEVSYVARDVLYDLDNGEDPIDLWNSLFKLWVKNPEGASADYFWNSKVVLETLYGGKWTSERYQSVKAN